jgi:hypothetical protein
MVGKRSTQTFRVDQLEETYSQSCMGVNQDRT